MVRCGGCRGYFSKDDVKSFGIQNFCASCNPGTWRTAPTPYVRRPMKKKAVKNPMPAGLRDEVLEADGHRCRFCGKTDNLQVHHVIYRSGGGKHERGNLITLCNEHHDTVHSDKGKYQKLCQQVIMLRDTRGDKQITIARIM